MLTNFHNFYVRQQLLL